MYHNIYILISSLFFQITASHLPEDRNGLKFFSRSNGGLTHKDIDILAESTCAVARSWYDSGILPSTSGYGAVYCSDYVDYMPIYVESLRKAIYAELAATATTTNDNNDENDTSSSLPLAGLKIVLNAGNGSGYFFNQVLKACGADVSHSIHLVPNGTFPKPTGVPNPEYKPMMDETIEACQACNADIGIMLDTDADRSGFVVPRRDSDGGFLTYDVLNRNRLIALLGVVFADSSPGCTIVTDSVTSEGLATFLTKTLGLKHVRYLKGYANVIGKAKDITESGQGLAEVAIETSGHCALRENGYLDDGTYTAVKVVGLLARMMKKNKDSDISGTGTSSLFDLIADLEELDEVQELRMEVIDGSLETTKTTFSNLQSLVEKECANRSDWVLDEENLEGVRVRTSTTTGFFMLRKSLHDPILSLQVEGKDKHSVGESVVGPLSKLIKDSEIMQLIDASALETYFK